MKLYAADHIKDLFRILAVELGTNNWLFLFQQTLFKKTPINQSHHTLH